MYQLNISMLVSHISFNNYELKSNKGRFPLASLATSSGNRDITRMVGNVTMLQQGQL